MIEKYDFFKTKYGEELLIDLIRLESLEKYIYRNANPHTLSYFDITLITSGDGSFSIDQYQYPVCYGRILFSSPGQIRHWNIESMPKGYVLIFEEEFLSCFLNDKVFISGLRYFHNYSSPPELIVSAEEVSHLIKLFEDIEKEMELFGKNDKHILRALLLQVLVWLNRKYMAVYQADTVREYNRHIQKFIGLVDDQFAQNHNVSYYAGSVNVSAGHLNDLCKKHLSMSAKEYIQNRIMIEAKRMLHYSDIAVSEIASRLNFEDTSYFIRQFKQSTGTTPFLFRKAKNP